MGKELLAVILQDAQTEPSIRTSGTYDGGKNGDGVYHKIINQIQPHLRFVELFAGSCPITARKKPAAVNIVVELDPVAISAAKSRLSMVDVEWRQMCALKFLSEFPAGPDDFIYADPPYLKSTRTQQRDLYRFEFGDAHQHETLLSILDETPAPIVISGYASSLYDRMLPAPKWRKVKFIAGSRGGPREEILWCNFAEPARLHDYRFLGADFTDRQRIGRKIARWKSKLSMLPALEREAILEGIIA